MAKKINVKTIDYTVTANVVVDGSNGLEIRSYEDFGFTTKAKRELMKHIRDEHVANGFEVLAIRDVDVKRVEHVTTFIIEATNAEIVDACMSAGLVVRDANATDEDSEE